MPVLFPSVYQLIRREKGSYVDGVWTPAIELEAEEIVLDIQPATDFDYARVQAISAGRRVTAMVTATAALDAGLHVAGADSYPGDIVLYNNERWIAIGSARFNSLGNSDTAHARYLFTLEIEYGEGEV
jgi:hypothetical protein